MTQAWSTCVGQHIIAINSMMTTRVLPTEVPAPVMRWEGAVVAAQLLQPLAQQREVAALVLCYLGHQGGRGGRGRGRG